jgi:hypothetical protein
MVQLPSKDEQVSDDGPRKARDRRIDAIKRLEDVSDAEKLELSTLPFTIFHPADSIAQQNRISQKKRPFSAMTQVRKIGKRPSGSSQLQRVGEGAGGDMEAGRFKKQ